jgi:pyrroline-5-carboxylate reductase
VTAERGSARAQARAHARTRETEFAVSQTGLHSARMLSGKRIAFVGAGNMAEALVKGLVASDRVRPTDLVASGRRSERVARVAERYGITAAPDNPTCVAGAAIVVLAVKPQVMSSVLAGIAPHVPDHALVVSVAAGVTTAAIEAHLRRGVHVIRTMPNTAAMVGRSATAIAAGAHATPEDLAVAREIFDAVGRVVVVDEVHLDAVTGLSGSGPAYIFLIIEALSDAGVKVGLSREVALELAAQTLAGSAHMLLETGEHPGRLKDQVTSPGGTAIAGLHTLEAGGLRTTLINAVEAATRRARELGEAQK